MFKLNRKKIKENIKIISILCIIVILLTFVSILLTEKRPQAGGQDQELEDGKNHIQKLVISEIMSNNGGAVASSDGRILDWIELYNGSSKDISLKNCGLSDTEDRAEWIFPDVTIKAKSYLVVFLSGKREDGLFASFKLDSTGNETVTLKDAGGNLIDTVKTISLSKNQVYFRNLDGEFQTTMQATPGYENSKAGYEQYIKELMIEEADDLQITEILPHNKGHFKDQYGNYSGYIEITNTGSNTISLKGYTLSGDIYAPFKWSLPDEKIKPGESKVIFTSNKNRIDKQWHSNFKLDAENGVVILAKEGKIVEKVEYSYIPNGMAYIKDKEWIISGTISPGYPNTNEGIEKFSNQYYKNQDGLIINEVMNHNTSYLAQNGNEYYDWIELKNNSKEDIALKEYSLSTNENKPMMYSLPDVTLKPGQYYVVMASGDTNLSNQSYQHTNFKLGDEEGLYLWKNKEVVDSMFLSDIPIHYSFGRNNESGFFYMENPSPGKENSEGVRAVASVPLVSKASGVYNDVENFRVEIIANGTIYYTTDGSTPSTKSSKYTGPIFLTSTTSLRAVNIEEGKLPSSVITNSYIVNENHTLPVLSVSMNPSDFSSVERNAWNEELEVEAYAELYEKNNSFSIPCGFKLFGGSTRGMAKKSFALKFRKEYGPASLHYPVFDTRDFSKFDTLVLRSGSQDSENAFLRDIFATSVMEDTEVEVQAYKSIILYINGKYWGVYNIREKVDDTFLANHFNVDGSKGNIVRTDYNVSLGSSNDYRSIIQFLTTHDMTKKENYEQIKEMVNINSLIDFWIGEIYTNNNDIINSRTFTHPDIDGNKLHFIYYDLDYSLYFPMNNYYTFMTNPEGMSDFKVPTTFMRSMFQSKEFKKDFVERLSEQLKTTWSTENLSKKLEDIYNHLKPEMERNQKRWGMTMKDWEDSLDVVREYIEKRKAYLLKQTKEFFSLSNDEMNKYFGEV